MAIANLAWGLSARQTLLFGLPYRLEPSGPEATRFLVSTRFHF